MFLPVRECVTAYSDSWEESKAEQNGWDIPHRTARIHSCKEQGVHIGSNTIRGANYCCELLVGRITQNSKNIGTNQRKCLIAQQRHTSTTTLESSISMTLSFPYSREINRGGQYGKYGEIPSYGISCKQPALKFNTVNFCGCIKYSLIHQVSLGSDVV